MNVRTLHVVRDGNTVAFYDESGEAVDLLVVLSLMLAGQVELRIEDFAVRLESATLQRIGEINT